MLGKRKTRNEPLPSSRKRRKTRSKKNKSSLSTEKIRLNRDIYLKKAVVSNPSKALFENKYHPYFDLTLSKTEAKHGAFYFNKRLNWHTGSKARIVGPKSGRHEGPVTTDMVILLSNAVDNGNGTHTLPLTDTRSLKAYSEDVINSRVYHMVLNSADGFRTDTAQTALSRKGGKSAGHTHSGISTSGQEEAHQLLRDKVMPMLKLSPNENSGLTQKSIAVLFGSIAISSMAPKIMIANDFPKESFKALSAYESHIQNRNKAKKRLTLIYNTHLNKAEQSFVMEHGQDFMNSTLDPSNNVPVRWLGHTPSSPIRHADAPTTQESLYLSGPMNIHDNTLRPPDSPLEYGLYLTEPFRSAQRNETSIEPLLKAYDSKYPEAMDVDEEPASSTSGLSLTKEPGSPLTVHENEPVPEEQQQSDDFQEVQPPTLEPLSPEWLASLPSVPTHSLSDIFGEEHVADERVAVLA